MRIKRYDYQRSCWWCGDIADSREHKYKKTDVVNLYGREEFSKFGGLTWVYEGKQHPVQGPNSVLFKFNKNLCHRCNTKRSAAYDNAYEIFISFCEQNYVELIKHRIINISDVFGPDYKEKAQNLKRYFAKHVGCRLAGLYIQVPKDMVQFLDGKNKCHLKIDVGLRADALAMEAKLLQDELDPGTLWIGDLMCMWNKRRDDFSSFWSHYGYRGIRFSYYYGKSKDFSDNITDCAIKLEFGWNLDPRKILTP